MILRKLLILVGLAVCPLLPAQELPYYPTDIQQGLEGEVVIAHKGLRSVDVFSADPAARLLRSYPLTETPTGLCVRGETAYVTTFETGGRLHFLSLLSGKTSAVVKVGSGACHPLLHPDGDRVYVFNRYENSVSEVDVAAQKVLRTVSVIREPVSGVISKDGRYLFVLNFLPAGRADGDHVAASVSVIDLPRFTRVKDIVLTNGSNALRGICLTPDGKYIYVVHNLGRYTVPTSQLHQGWMNTSALSVIEVAGQRLLGCFSLDEPERGAAGIWSVACDEDQVWVSHSGTHEISVIDHRQMLDRFFRYEDKKRLEYDLRFLYGIRQRIALKGNGPRSMALVDGRLFVPTYFADVLNVLDVKDRSLASVCLNPLRKERPEDKGERIFNDAAKCFQNWQSCNGCHPGDGRVDGMNWDLLNDGIGNPKNCKSLLLSHVTAPCMISGIREHAEKAVRAGFNFIQFYEISEEEAVCVDAYLKALRPVPSPYLRDGRLSPLAEKGKKVYERLKCGDCHSGVHYTDLKMHRIGEDIEFENGWDTPALKEVWRTAPYLFDGRAATMEEVFSVHRHGISSKISKKDIEALTEYVNSL